jgi:hypothetical protein
VDKGLLAMIVVVFGFLGNMLLERYRQEQAQQQAAQKALFDKRLDAIQSLSDDYGKLLNGFLSLTQRGPLPTDTQARAAESKSRVDELNSLSTHLLYQLARHEVAISEEYRDELERQLWIYRGISKKDPETWAQYRPFVVDLSHAVDHAWRAALPMLEGETRRPAPIFEAEPMSQDQILKLKTEKYLDLNFGRWQQWRANRDPAQNP